MKDGIRQAGSTIMTLPALHRTEVMLVWYYLPAF